MPDDASEVAADIQTLIDSAPDHIWLDLGENLEALTDDATFRDLSEVTWSEDNATGCGIKYVRASQSDGTSGVPDGLKLAPVEPTDEMLKAGRKAIHDSHSVSKKALLVYQAMLAAAPNQGENHVG